MMYIVIMVHEIVAVGAPSPITGNIIPVAIAVVIIGIWLWLIFSRSHDQTGSATSGPVSVDLVNQRSGEHKYIKVGFSWVLFLFSGVLGIPLFVRRLHVWGGVFFALWLIYLLGPRFLAAQSTELGALSAIDLWLVLNVIFLGLAIWIGIKGNEMTAKNLLEKGWILSSPDNQATRLAMTKWNLSDHRVSRNGNEIASAITGNALLPASTPKMNVSEPITFAPMQDAISQRAIESSVLPSGSLTTIENHQRLWETKFDIYLRVCKAAGILAVSRSDTDAFAIAEKDLVAIYSGEFNLIASPDASAALATFVDHLHTRSADHLGPLKSEAQKLALACRQDTGAQGAN
jgi:hypothetical protein